MARPSKLSDRDQVTEHIKKLEPSLSKMIEYLRESILKIDSEIGECIKWNNPCFYYTGEMKPFNPKEYKREIIVFNLFKGRVMLVFPSGGKINDQTGFLTGDYKDGRRLAIFNDMEDVKSKEQLLHTVVKKWLTLVDK